MICTQNEEIESLQAIFCKNGEFTARKGADGLHITVAIDSSAGISSTVTGHCLNESQVAVSFLLLPGYPLLEPPKISVRCAYIPADLVAAVERQVAERAADLMGQSMLFDLCNLTQELLEKEITALKTTSEKSDHYDSNTPSEKCAAISEYLQVKTANKCCSMPDKGFHDCLLEMKTTDRQSANDKCTRPFLSHIHTDTKVGHEENVQIKKRGQNLNKTESDSKVVTSLLQLDHMRSQNNYIKLIKKWTAELGLTGRLVFCRKLILLLLQGSSRAVKEYIVRNRTTNVDVDARGRACKERLLTVLAEVPAENHLRLSDFCVLELPTTESLQQLFQACAMEDLFAGYVSRLVGPSLTKKRLS